MPRSAASLLYSAPAPSTGHPTQATFLLLPAQCSSSVTLGNTSALHPLCLTCREEPQQQRWPGP